MIRELILEQTGFPLTMKTLREMQINDIRSFAALAYMCGNKTILTGLNQSGNSHTAGYVSIEGEILYFAPGETRPNVEVVTETENATFKTLSGVTSVAPAYRKKYMRFAPAGTGFPFSDLTRAITMSQLAADVALIKQQNAVFQSGGGMIFWNKPANQIPAGWAEVVNWRGRFPVGVLLGDADFGTLGQQGGAKTVKMTEENLIAHAHDGHVRESNFSVGTEQSIGGKLSEYGTTQDAGYDDPEPMKILNPYRTVFFIEWVGL